MLVNVHDVSNKSFDYIIVGGGTAGLVLAARLSEEPTVTVCVLEGGPANIDDVSILRTGMFATGFGNPSYDWAHTTTKQKSLADRSVFMARGRGLGGSSGMNFAVWQRPPAEELDDFEKLGNPGWNWKNMSHYMKKAERFSDPTDETQQILNIPCDHWDLGREGPLPISFSRTTSKLDAIIQTALHEAGLHPAEDPYGGKPHGAYYSVCSYNAENHQRSYATPAYYVPNKDRPNLKVLVNARVDRIETDQSASGELVATGVEFTHEDKNYVVKAAREVIVSAGGLRSSVVLERSGIGRKDILEKVGIPVRLVLPGVGENLQEHICGVSAWELKDNVPYPTFDVLRDTSSLPRLLELYKEGNGELCMGVMNMGFAPLEQVTNQAQAIHKKAHDYANDFLKRRSDLPGLAEQFKIQLDRLQPGKGPVGPGCEFIVTPGLAVSPMTTPPGKKYLGITCGLNHLLSRGSIHVMSSDPSVEPEIDPHYFEHTADLDVFVEMCKYTRKIVDQPSLKSLIAHEVIPGPEVQTDEQLGDFIKANFSTTWHTASTCSMLPREKGGVVDNHLKVYGTTNLRVVDLSIVPLHFAAHPQCVVYGIAEMAADIIKGVLII